MKRAKLGVIINKIRLAADANRSFTLGGGLVSYRSYPGKIGINPVSS